MPPPSPATSIQHLQTALSELISLIELAKRQLIEAGQGWQQGARSGGSARDELGAVVEQSAAAAESILAACEELDQLTDGIADPDGALKACTMRIFEACAFQDLIAQRVKKVAGLVQDMEQRLILMLGALEIDALASAPCATPTAPSLNASLLNGPALTAPRQEDIDRLLGD